MLRSLILFFAAVSAASAQVHFHFGLDAGVPLTDTLSSSTSSSTSATLSTFDRYNSVTKRLIAGPVLRVDFASGFGFEFDALYQRVDYDDFGSTVEPGYNNQTFQAVTGNRWQFPLLIQYTRRRVFVEGGLSISRIGDGQIKLTDVTLGSSPSSNSSAGPSSVLIQPGIVAGAGLDFPLLRGHLRPELRYTHWIPAGTSPGFNTYSVVNNPLPGIAVYLYPPPGFNTKPNELSFLAGWTF